MFLKGPFIFEFETLGQLEQFAEENRLSKRCIHLEIYLVAFTTSDTQANLKAILREPVGQLEMIYRKK